MKYDVIVIGAGMVGVSAAWHLQKNGSKVLLLDKNSPGSETSYGNAGLIQREAVRVFSFPRQVSELMRVLPNSAPDIRYRWGAIWKYQQPLLKYWLNSSAKSVEKIEQEWATLIKHSTSEHEPMIKAAGAEDLLKKVGWIELHRTASKLNETIDLEKYYSGLGVEFDVLSPEDLQKLEPNLKVDDFVGAIHWKNSWQITHPGNLVKAYASNFKAMQGEFKQAGVQSIEPIDSSNTAESGWRVTVHKETNDKGSDHKNATDSNTADTETYTSQHVVVATGIWSAQLLKPLGYNLPLFPLRGYHQHFETTTDNMLNHSLIDRDIGFVMAPMRQGIRVTTGAEMTALDAPKNFAQLEAVLKYAKQLLPLQTAVEAEAWCGSRPCFPDMKPVISAASKHDNLWLAFGHGHQGFTLGPVTGRLIEEMIHNKPTLIDTAPFSSRRFD